MSYEILLTTLLTHTAVFFTGGSLNPARSVGPDIVLGKFDGYHWIYWVGPLLGAIIAVLFYRLIKFLEYETANPGADSDGQDVRYDVRIVQEDDTEGSSQGSKFSVFPRLLGMCSC